MLKQSTKHLSFETCVSGDDCQEMSSVWTLWRIPLLYTCTASPVVTTTVQSLIPLFKISFTGTLKSWSRILLIWVLLPSVCHPQNVKGSLTEDFRLLAIKKNFWHRKFFNILWRCCWVPVYIHTMIFYLMFSLRCKEAVFSASVSYNTHVM